jgi:hypothetical protein
VNLVDEEDRFGRLPSALITALKFLESPGGVPASRPAVSSAKIAFEVRRVLRQQADGEPFAIAYRRRPPTNTGLFRCRRHRTSIVRWLGRADDGSSSLPARFGEI